MLLCTHYVQTNVALEAKCLWKKKKKAFFAYNYMSTDESVSLAFLFFWRPATQWVNYVLLWCVVFLVELKPVNIWIVVLIVSRVNHTIFFFFKKKNVAAIQIKRQQQKVAWFFEVLHSQTSSVRGNVVIELFNVHMLRNFPTAFIFSYLEPKFNPWSLTFLVWFSYPSLRADVPYFLCCTLDLSPIFPEGRERLYTGYATEVLS